MPDLVTRWKPRIQETYGNSQLGLRLSNDVDMWGLFSIPFGRLFT